MVVGSVLGWIVAGLIIGAVARLLVPGRQSIGLILTIVLGIVGAFAGGYVSTLLFGPRFVLDPNGPYLVETAWPGWLMSILGATLVLGIAVVASTRRSNRIP
jgi:uncharacterized membrane protein YeaQ/YmgE (transglycosylase-associated protein family)